MSNPRYTREEKGKGLATQKQSKQWIREPPILLPDTENEELIEDHRLTLIGRILHPETQVPSAIINFLPQIWGLLGRVEGKVLGRERFQFRFETEEDMEAVLRRAPFHYKRWMMVLQRWEPSTSPSFPNQIPFWIKINDLPSHFWTFNNLQAIGRALGSYLNQETKEARIQVQFNAFEPLVMKKNVQLKAGEEAPVEFVYERLEKHCFLCYVLTHEEKDCPIAKKAHATDSRSRGLNQLNTVSRLEEDKRRRGSIRQKESDDFSD